MGEKFEKIRLKGNVETSKQIARPDSAFFIEATGGFQSSFNTSRYGTLSIDQLRELVKTGTELIAAFDKAVEDAKPTPKKIIEDMKPGTVFNIKNESSGHTSGPYLRQKNGTVMSTDDGYVFRGDDPFYGFTIIPIVEPNGKVLI